MKTRLFLTLLGFICLLNFVKSQCDLKGRKDDVEFPDLAKYVAESYIMGVEYSVNSLAQTDYYTEYYDNIFKKGRIDSHISGENKKYIYYAETEEAWVIEGRKCVLQNITLTPDFFKDDMTDWDHFPGSTTWPTTVGPSGMFKNAYDAWKNRNIASEKKMAYMGKSDTDVRGEPAVFWRRCLDGDGYADYYFAGENAENPFDTGAYDRVITPLRVVFYDLSATDKELATQSYDILSFQHLIPAGVDPFELPKGQNCERGTLVDGPKLPTFKDQSIFLSAEVVYERYSTKDDGYERMSSYYSTLMLALDQDIKHLAYYYSDWNTTIPDQDDKEVNPPTSIIYDMLHKYKYSFSFDTGKCEISRANEFIPKYRFPENGGSMEINDPYVLFPDNQLYYLTTGKVRGLDVDIFEAEIKGYPLDKDTLIDRAIATHAYLRSNEVSENTVEVTKAPVQIQLRLYRKENTEEIVTFNIFGFTTRMPSGFKQYLFDITRCFKNDDDYSYLTIGFEVEPNYMIEMPKKLPEIQENVLNQITLKSELNPVRIPKVMTDIKDNYVYVTLLILGKPPLALDFNAQEADLTIVVQNDAEDTLGIATFDMCATACLEDRGDCWGFALCGNTCYFGLNQNKKTETKKGCNLVRRYNGTNLQSKDLQISQIVGQIQAGEFLTMVTMDSGERVELKATIAQVTDPAEDDSLFEKMGNQLNPRMRVLKAATKLKKEVEVKNMGKLRYDECQRLCLDFKDCETISYCLMGSKCILSKKYGSDLKPEDMEADPTCNLLTRKYADHFDRTPGIFVKVGGGTEKDATTVEDCAMACLKESKFKCLSFDHCSGVDKKGCTLYTTHYVNPKARKEVEVKNPSCGHYTRKFSNEFKRKDETRILGSKVPTLTNLTLEECAKACIEYGQGTCYGYDFCQDKTLFATSCTLFDEDPSRLKSTYSPICTNYAREGAAYAPRPYTNSYAGGIGFLCFLVGGIVGAIVVFAIAYIRVNRQ